MMSPPAAWGAEPRAQASGTDAIAYDEGAADSRTASTGDAVVMDRVTRRYRRQRAVDDVSGAIRADVITGLVGRNGSGKTTLLRLIAGHEFCSRGTVAVFGRQPVENPWVARRLTLIREDQTYPDFRVQDAVAAAGAVFPNWDARFAATMIGDFDVPANRKIKKLSRGMRSALGIVLGLASRAELTMFDEPMAGLDPVARQIFYDHILADYVRRPRAIVISTHLVDEVAGLIEEVLLMRRGHLVLAAPAEEIRDSACTVTGDLNAVTRWAADHGHARVEALGSRGRAVLPAMVAADRAAAEVDGLAVTPMSLQQSLAWKDREAGTARPSTGSIVDPLTEGVISA